MNYRFITLLFGSARMFFDQSRVILFLHQLIHVLDFCGHDSSNMIKMFINIHSQQKTGTLTSAYFNSIHSVSNHQ